ncbi:hypothetical protein AB0451_39935 [Streptomyces sp. NPDC052000]|uniref:hypothetical protein n=1 Tax=Streptomyces sp. NPDC052000 TaxID=3155676 RepID=UPI00344F1589
MARTILPPPFSVPDLIPELADLVRETTLLYPRSGAPHISDSSIGGPLLWPVAEPWPQCADPGHYNPAHVSTAGAGAAPVTMVPVVQLYARDVPELPFPQGCDVLQIVWCPLIHESQDQCTVLPQLHWRNEAEVTATGAAAKALPAPYESDDDFVPRPCTVSPTRVEEYPNWDMPTALTETLGDRFDDIEAEFGCSYYDIATTIRARPVATRAGLSPRTGPTAPAGNPWNTCSASPLQNRAPAVGFPRTSNKVASRCLCGGSKPTQPLPTPSAMGWTWVTSAACTSSFALSAPALHGRTATTADASSALAV